MILRKIIPIILSLSLLTACAGKDGNEGEQTGTAAGAVIGAAVGSKMTSGEGKILGAGLGAIFGAWLGKVIGRNLDEADLQKANETAQETMETADVGQTNTWSNPDSGNSGTYTPTSARTEENGEQCRDFESTVIIDGKEEPARGRACRQPDGTWKIVE
jgi:surface antigen